MKKNSRHFCLAPDFLDTGFTLLELLIAVSILGIVSVIAIGSYSSYVRKARRMDGINTLLAISLAESRYRASNAQYGTLAQVWNSISTSPEGYYTIGISGISATGYTLTATGVGSQANDRAGSTACSPLTLTFSNGVVTKSPSACWPA